MPRQRIALGLLACLGLAYALSSLRHLSATDRFYVLDSPVLPAAPRVLDYGWHFIPSLFGRVSEYPASTVKLRTDLSGGHAAKSREGAKVEVEAELTYAIPAERVLDLHRTRGPGYVSDWLSGLLWRETKARLAQVSYDAVRNRDPELAGGVLGVLRDQVSKEGLRIEALRIFPIAGVGEASGSILRAGV